MLPSTPENLRAAYAEVCTRYRAVDDFRAKLLGFLPLASGAGIFLLLSNAFSADKTSAIPVQVLTPVGIFGAAVALALYFYELRGIQYCTHLIAAGRGLEDALAIPGAFSTRPAKHVGGMISEISASHLIYGAVIAAWTFVASVFAFGRATPPAPAVLPASLLALAVAVLMIGGANRLNLRPDQIRIAAISMDSPARFGALVDLAVSVSVDLRSGKAGFVELGFNSKSAESFTAVEQRKVEHGATQLLFRASVTPMDWGDAAPFCVIARLGRTGDGPMTTAQRTVLCRPNANRAQSGAA